MIILSCDPGKNFGLCLYDSIKNKVLLKTLTFKSSKEAFVSFQREFELFLENNVDNLDSFIIEFSQFGVPPAMLSHYFYITTCFGVISRTYGGKVYYLDSSKYGLSPSTWQPFIAKELGLKAKQFDKSQSIKFANKILSPYKKTVNQDHEADAACIMYYYIKYILKLDCNYLGLT
jgi:hypothetical protein